MERSTQKQMERIDEEVQFVKEKNGGRFTPKAYLDWLELRGSIRQQLNGDSFIVTNKFEDGKHLYSILVRRFEDWQQWKKNGKKVRDISNFGINESTTTQQEDKKVEKSKLDLQGDFDADIAAAFGESSPTNLQ